MAPAGIVQGTVLNEQPKVITAEYLDSIKYNDLKEEFAKLGVGKVFKGGVAKSELIKNALVALSRLEEAKAEAQEEAIKKVEEADNEKKEEIETPAEKSDESKPDEEEIPRQMAIKKDESTVEKTHADVVSKIIAPEKLSQEVIENILKKIVSNLKNEPGKAAKKILLDKQKKYEAMLEE